MATFELLHELNVDRVFIIPPQKPPAECLLDCIVAIEIQKAVVIDTPLLVPEITVDTPLQKILICGLVTFTFKYSAAVPDQQVHAAHFTVPFHEVIEWPGGPPQGTPIEVIPIIERECCNLIDDRRIMGAILLRLDIYTV